MHKQYFCRQVFFFFFNVYDGFCLQTSLKNYYDSILKKGNEMALLFCSTQLMVLLD